MTNLNDILQRYRYAERELREYKRAKFPTGSMVYVENFTERGFGIVGFASTSVDAISVCWEKDYERFYPIEHCRPATEDDVLPEWIVKRKGAKG